MWAVISEVIAWHLCGVVCGCVVKRGPHFLAACQAGLGFGRVVGVRVCPFRQGLASLFLRNLSLSVLDLRHEDLVAMGL